MNQDDSPLASFAKTISRQSSSMELKKGGKWDKLPPVHLWNPPLSGEMDLLIDKEGGWIYKGRPISRDKTVKLFSRILKKENNHYYLVTPVEKWKISVEDTPWIIVSADICNEDMLNKQVIRVETNLGDAVEISPTSPLTMEFKAGQCIPYVLVRDNLRARINRPTFYQLTNYAGQNEEGKVGVWSHGSFFPMEIVI